MTFDGDPLNYISFASSFQTHIINEITSDNARLTYLLQHCKPQVKSFIDHFLGTPDGFKRAWKKLYHHFGRPILVVTCCEEKLLECPKLKSKDESGLRSMARMM